MPALWAAPDSLAVADSPHTADTLDGRVRDTLMTEAEGGESSRDSRALEWDVSRSSSPHGPESPGSRYRAAPSLRACR
jgi:hypothetical protein